MIRDLFIIIIQYNYNNTILTMQEEAEIPPKIK